MPSKHGHTKSGWGFILFILYTLRFVKGVILDIFNSIPTKKYNPPPILATLQVKDSSAQEKVPKRAGYISQCVIRRYKP